MAEPSYDPLKDAHWKFLQAVAWVAFRDIGRVREADEDWRRRNPCECPWIWSLWGWTPEVAAASRVVRQKLQSGAWRSSEQQPGQRRRWVDHLEHCDVDFMAPEPKGPDFYWRDTPEDNFIARREKPAFRNLLIPIDDILGDYPLKPEEVVGPVEAAPTMTVGDVDVTKKLIKRNAHAEGSRKGGNRSAETRRAKAELRDQYVEGRLKNMRAGLSHQRAAELIYKSWDSDLERPELGALAKAVARVRGRISRNEGPSEGPSMRR